MHIQRIEYRQFILCFLLYIRDNILVIYVEKISLILCDKPIDISYKKHVNVQILHILTMNHTNTRQLQCTNTFYVICIFFDASYRNERIHRISKIQIKMN